VAGHTYSLVFL